MASSWLLIFQFSNLIYKRVGGRKGECCIIKDYSVDILEMKFKNINDILKFLNDDIKNNNEIIYKLLNNSKTEINLSMNISNNNEISNKKLIEVNNEKNPNLENINISKKIRSNYNKSLNY